MENRPWPTIQSHFPHLVHSGALSKHIEEVKKVLQFLLPQEFHSLSLNEANKWLKKNLPLVKWSDSANTPDSLSIYFLYAPSQEVKAEKILPELIRKWLIPEKEVHILGFQNMYFYMREITDQLFFVAEMKILVENGRELFMIQEHLPLLTNEINLSLSSSKYFEHVLDTKGLSLDQKASQTQYYLRKLIQRYPKQFDIEIFREMSTFLALSQPNFQKFRLPKHLTRVIVSHYLMRHHVMHSLSIAPEKRHLEFRFIRSQLHFPFGAKSVLGISIAVGLKEKYESFDESHVLAAVQKFIPNAHIIQGSYYFYRANQDPIKYLYLELEKKDGTRIEAKEITLLKKELKEELKKRIAKLIPAVFMIRNEEEVMRNILLLSQELCYLSDLPQVMVNFDKQEENELYFTVLVVRVLKKHDILLEEAFKKVNQPFRFIPDRTQKVGYIRKKNPKEANVFHLCILKDRSILRTDSSVNFYLARQKVISIIVEALGEIRDYNGGMILKQGELFAQLRHSFGGIVEKNQELLENFFFALNPIEAQAIASLTSLKTLFQLFLEATQEELPKRESCFQKFKKNKNLVFAVLRTKDPSIETYMNEELSHLENFSKSLIRTQVNFQGTFLQGLIYESPSTALQKKFQNCIDRAIKRWISNIIHRQDLRLSFLDLPTSLDPRLGGDEIASALNEMLFEGLTRISRGGKPTLAIAKSIDISQDQKRYVFKLRPTFWSDHTRLIAYDFEYAWKKILSPSFYTPFVYVFYPIKNAKAAKEGKISLEKVGVKAVDDTTLVVELENPSPEFLELTAHPLYSPINHTLEKRHPNWAQSGEEAYVCNGPFKLKGFLSNGGYELVQNPMYWDRQIVKLDRIHISKNNSETALQMFKNDEIDWIGHPMRPWESYFAIDSEKIHCTKPLGTHWCTFNTQRYPFDNLKMRKALTYAIDRKQLTKQLPSGLLPAVTPLPQILSSISDKKIIHGDKRLAKKLFEEALKEMGLTKKNFPMITLGFTGGRVREKVAYALLQQWEEVLGISCRLEEYEFHTLFSKMVKGEYQLATITWKSWINDPIYTLSVFQYRTNRVNFSKWENIEYRQLLDEVKKEVHLEKRSHLYKRAEKILIQECPVIPLHYEVYKYMHKKQLKGAICSDLGNVDFREASIIPE